MKKPSKTKLALAVAIGSAIGTLIVPLLRGAQVDWLRAVFVGTFSLLVFLAIPKRWIERVPSEEKKEPIQPTQRNAGSCPSSDGSSVSETSSSLGPRG